jgi:hypothetical protein
MRKHTVARLNCGECKPRSREIEGSRKTSRRAWAACAVWRGGLRVPERHKRCYDWSTYIPDLMGFGHDRGARRSVQATMSRRSLQALHPSAVDETCLAWLNA